MGTRVVVSGFLPATVTPSASSCAAVPARARASRKAVVKWNQRGSGTAAPPTVMCSELQLHASAACVSSGAAVATVQVPGGLLAANPTRYDYADTSVRWASLPLPLG